MTKIQEVMSTNNLAVEIPGRRKDAMDIMVKNGLTWLPVVKKSTNTLVGAVSRYDLMSKPEEDQLCFS